ncbi:MAG: hypothetical protein GKR93_02425 [Gammaproteobacteria bacterium]|nr:hypothetical protein [Gammaproteobacteria bacterium]
MRYLILTTVLLLSAFRIVFALDVNAQDVYQHDAHFPQELDQFFWGVEAGKEPDTPLRQDVIIFNEAGEIVKEIPLPQGNLFGQVNWLHAIDIDAEGNIYLSDVVGNHVQKWTVQETDEK